MAVHALLGNVSYAADANTGAVSLTADVLWVGTSVAGANRSAVAISLVVTDTVASIGAKVLAAVDVQATTLGYPAPTNVLSTALAKLR